MTKKTEAIVAKELGVEGWKIMVEQLKNIDENLLPMDFWRGFALVRHMMDMIENIKE